MSNLLQFERLSSATVQEVFKSGTTPTDLDSGVPVVTITKPDGTTIASGTVTHVGAAGSGTYQFVLAGQPECTELTVAWTGTIGGQPQTRPGTIEIVGAHLFTIADLRDYAMPGSSNKPFEDAVKYPDAKLHKARAATLARFTKALRVSPVPRHAREVYSIGYGDHVMVTEPLPRKLLSVTVAGVAKPTSGYFLASGGVVLPVSGYTAGTWGSYGVGVVAIEYEHGRDGVDDDGSDAALQYAAAKLNPSGFTTGTTYSSPDGMSVTYEPSEVGRGGFQRFTGIRDVDRWLNLNGDRAGVA